jgi:Tol biopolymer transport system component/poly(3-hydroxybutyrate) depolymerase
MKDDARVSMEAMMQKQLMVRFVIILVGCALLVSVPLAQAPVAPTVEQIMSAPFATGLVASPAGQQVAWVFNERGARNLWVAEGPAFAGRRLTAFEGDNGQEIAGLRFTPDGRAVVFVRGGGANRAGEIPNPTSDAAGAEQIVWAMPLSGGEPRKIGTGDGAVVSPKGDAVAFVQKGQIWLGNISGTPAATQGPKTRGSAASPRWSPDGSKLAFVSARNSHAFIGVYDVRAETVTWLDPSVDRDTEPAWSPDGRQIAFIRQPVNGDAVIFVAARGRAVEYPRRGRGDQRRPRGVAGGSGAGSVFQGVTGPQLAWMADGHLVFRGSATAGSTSTECPSRGTGDAADARRVRSGGRGPRADRRSVIFNSNQDDLDRRHLWRVSPGGAPQALTTGTAIEWNPAPLPDGQIAYLRADARRPGQPVIQNGAAGAREIAPGSIPASYPASALVEPEAVTITAADGMQAHAQLFKPRESGTEKHPAVVFFHGGSRRQMLLGWHYMDYYHNTYAFNQFLASRGYVVLSVNYRSGTGYGLEFREAINYGAGGASEFGDVVGAGLYLRGRPDVDPARIGVWGGSYGGYLSAMALSRAPHLFSAGVDIHGVHDWTVAIRNFQPSFNPWPRRDVARLASHRLPWPPSRAGARPSSSCTETTTATCRSARPWTWWNNCGSARFTWSESSSRTRSMASCCTSAGCGHSLPRRTSSTATCEAGAL